MFYFIIDKAHVLHLREAESLEKVKETWYNETGFYADHVIQAEKCCHANRYKAPIPEWMEYTGGKYIVCTHCPTPKASYEARQLARTKPTSPPLLFEHF